MFFTSLSRHSDLGFLIIRIIFGCMFLFYGTPMLFGGAAKWVQVGGAMGSIGITFWPAFWGFCAAITEFLGGICLILGLFFRPVCSLLAFTMFVAVAMHFKKGDGLLGTAHALEDGAVFCGLIFIGPGKYSLDVLLLGR